MMLLLTWAMFVSHYDRSVEIKPYATEQACFDTAWSTDRSDWNWWTCSKETGR